MITTNIYGDEYKQAANILKEYVNIEHYEIPTKSEDVETALASFREKFLPELLAHQR